MRGGAPWRIGVCSDVEAGLMRNAVPTKIVSRSSGNTKKVLLFTGGGGAGSRHSIDCWGALRGAFRRCRYEAKPYSVASNSWHQIPFASDRTFVDEVHRLCHDIKVDLLIPGVDEELLPIAQARIAWSARYCCHLMRLSEYTWTS